ncbi:MAG: TonB-dependent receptor [Pseudomonadota bacterium]
MKISVVHFAIVLAFIPPVSVIGAENGAEGPIVITATRIPTPLQQIASSVTIITAEDIRANQWRSLPEALAAQPGMRIVTSGSVGAQTSLFTRGTNSNHTLVLLNGIDISDPSTPNGAYDFAHLDLSNIERIEIVRGPQSTLYGSGAVGGVINIITKRGQGPSRYTASVEGGSFHTYTEKLSARGNDSLFHYSMEVSQFNTAGQSITPERLRAGQDDENDGYRNTTVSFQGGITPTTDTEFNLHARSIHAHSQLDIGSGEDPDSESSVAQRFIRLEAKTTLLEERWKPVFGYSRSRQNRQTDNNRQSSLGDDEHTRFLGESEKADFQNQIVLSNNNSAVLGYETKTDRMTAAGNSAFGSAFGDFILTENTSVQERIESWYLQEQFTLADDFHGTVGVRSDNYDSFPGARTWRFTPLYAIPATATKLKASYGTGYRAPSLYERFGSTQTNFGTAYTGNPALKPEESRGWEIGVEQALKGGRLEPYFTYYKNRITNLIKVVYLPSFDSTSVNIDNATTEGYETGISFHTSHDSTITAEYTRTRTQDQNGQELLRRPRQMAHIQGKTRISPLSDVTLSLDYTGRRKDVDRVSGATIVTGGYTLAVIGASWQSSKNTRLHGRVENLFNKKYEPIDGFQGTGAGFFVGAEASF